MSGQKTLAIVTAGASLFAMASLVAEAGPGAPPPGPGLDLIQRSCVNCHDIYMITTKRKTPREWAEIVGVMADRGAEVTPDELQVIESYLVENFSTGAADSAAAH